MASALVRSGPVGLSKNDQREEQAWEGEDRLLGGNIIHAEGVRQYLTARAKRRNFRRSNFFS
jgi:hypothetical protein